MFKFKKLHVQNKRVYMYRYSSNSSSLCFMLSSNTILWLLHSNGYLSINVDSIHASITVPYMYAC